MAAGGLLVVGAVLDVYLTVLSVTRTMGPLSWLVVRTTWAGFRGLRRLLRSQGVLGHAGPTMLVLLVMTWIGLMLFGFALIHWRALGAGVEATSPPTGHSFGTALYYSGYTVTTLGLGDLVPRTWLFRTLTWLEAGLGFAVFTLAVTYFLSIYSALSRRNRFALLLHEQTGRTANPADLLIGLGPGGDFRSARTQLTAWSAELLDLLQSHQTYPVLHFMRMTDPLYAMARIAHLCGGAGTLLQTALDPGCYPGLVRSSAARSLLSSTSTLLEGTASDFLPQKDREACRPDEAQEREWRRRYREDRDRLCAEGLALPPDAAGSEDEHVRLLREWLPLTHAFARHMDFSWDEIVPPPACPPRFATGTDG